MSCYLLHWIGTIPPSVSGFSSFKCRGFQYLSDSTEVSLPLSRSDKTLQDIVYKLVPGLFKSKSDSICISQLANKKWRNKNVYNSEKFTTKTYLFKIFFNMFIICYKCGWLQSWDHIVVITCGCFKVLLFFCVDQTSQKRSGICFIPKSHIFHSYMEEYYDTMDVECMAGFEAQALFAACLDIV